VYSYIEFRFWISDIWNKSRVSLPTYPAHPTYQQIGLERQKPITDIASQKHKNI